MSTIVNRPPIWAALSSDSSPPGSLADKLNRLFAEFRPDGRSTPCSNKEVAAAIKARGGSISDVYIWQLRTGRRENPTRDHLTALARFFDVSPAYFFDRPDDAGPDADAGRAADVGADADAGRDADAGAAASARPDADAGPAADDGDRSGSYDGAGPHGFSDDADRATFELIGGLAPEAVSLRAVLHHKGLSPQSQHVVQSLVDRLLDLEQG